MTDKFTFQYGIHRGTITSRDVGKSEHDTEDAAMNEYRESKRWYNGRGYVYWYAQIVRPDGTIINLEQNTNYAR